MKAGAIGRFKNNATRLTHEQRLELIRFIDENPHIAQSIVAEKFEINQSTVSRVIKNRDSILETCLNYLKFKQNSCQLGKHCFLK